ncbi:MAG: hypothetical protein BA863_01365 [Desulfovibrio sp. S3730MH75]|nr:MAG: hypothetical protein BA863_01365 [Desulfovibrio sp. S3730MH75]
MKSDTKRILFFVPEWPALASGVLHSQVLSVARFLSESGFECLFVGCEVSDEKATEAGKKVFDVYGIQAFIYGIHSEKHGYVGRLLTARKVYRLTQALVRSFRPTHVYSRSLVGSAYARRIAADSDVISIFDVRGASSEEVKLKRASGGLRYWYIRYLEKKEFRKADRLSCVSKNLRGYIGAQVGRKTISVIPSCVDQNKFFFDREARKEIRAGYGLADDCKLICYCGGLSAWQRVGDIISLFEKLTGSNTQYRFLFVTKQTQQLQKLLGTTTLSKESYFVESCAQDEVYRYLSAADAGIIMRDDTVVNNVASPIKIGEYLGCGLPIILTKGIGDFSELIPQAGIGLLLDEAVDLVGQVNAFMCRLDIEEVRNHCVKFSHEHFAIESYLQEYELLYS